MGEDAGRTTGVGTEDHRGSVGSGDEGAPEPLSIAVADDAGDDDTGSGGDAGGDLGGVVGDGGGAGRRGSGTGDVRPARGGGRKPAKRKKSPSARGARQATVRVADAKKPAAKKATGPEPAVLELAGAIQASSAFVAMIRGAHWAIPDEQAIALADSYVKVGKRLEPYMPAVAAKLGPLAILADIGAAGAVTYVVIKPRIDADRELVRLRALAASGQPAVAAAPIEPAGVHRASATMLDDVRRTDGSTEEDSITVGGTDPTLIDRTAALGQEVGISPENVVELRHALGEDGPLLDTIAPGIVS